jgi:hypothetical protein
MEEHLEDVSVDGGGGGGVMVLFLDKTNEWEGV